MELEAGAKTGADYGEKSRERMAQRNGYRDLVLSRFGAAPLIA